VALVERHGNQEVTVTYDDDRASVKQLMETLKRRGYPISGMPSFVQ